MCFSAEASFGASAVLGTIGLVALRQVNHPKQSLFAAIPIFFALQQLAEGFVWLSFTQASWLEFRPLFATFFLIFALLVWPVWMPISVWLIEINPLKKKLLLIFIAAGILFALLVSFFLFNHTVFPEILDHHIHYKLGFSSGLWPGASLLYFVPTVLPAVFSCWKRVKLFGILLFAAYLLSDLYFASAVVSVWCYFSAIISLVILWALREMNLESRTEISLKLKKDFT